MDFTCNTSQIALYGDNHQLLAEVNFPDIDDTTVDIRHTFVDDSLRGQGIAGQLMAAVVRELQNTNKKAVLTCPYAQLWFQKHPEYNNLVK